MLSTLRRRLILSHVLPSLIMVPLMGIALIYVLETQVLLPSLTHELVEEARLTAEIVSNRADIWHEPAQAQKFVDRQKPYLTERMMLLDSGGHLLASSDPADAERLGKQLDFPGLTNVLAGKSSTSIFYSQSLSAEVADAAVPVVGPNAQALGIVRVTYRMGNVYSQFLRLRYLIAGVLAVGLFLGATVGWVLALNLERPLHQVTLAVHRLAGGQQLTPLPEQGPEEVRLLLQAFNSLVERLRMLEQNRRQLLANLVHEIGRPLGALHSAVQALMGGADEDTSLRQELLAGMDEELGRLRHLLDDLARLHDQVLGTLELNRQPVALGDWLPRLLAPRGAAARDKGLHWEVVIPADLPTLEIDRDRLGQAIGNLVSNATKYTPPKGTVSISAGVENGQVWIRVSDTGPGVAPEEQAHIFTPFYRGRSARRFPQGMGVGLSIARNLAIAHGGRIEVKSAPGQGSDFTLWIPMN
jgi:two-component system sensor histidine kinase BaeS